MSVAPHPPPAWGNGNPAEELARAKHFYVIGVIDSVEALEEMLDEGKIFERLAESEELHAQYLATFPQEREREQGIGGGGGWG
jgi:hypothetical protein